MRVKPIVYFMIFTVFLLFCLSTPVLARSMITGKVVDAVTGEPIEGAAVYIYWGKSGSGPPGLAASTVKVEVAEGLSDPGGSFKIPKYSTWFKHYRMAVYKKGYVCWSNEDIFPSYEKRKGFKLKNGMVIKLEHFRPEYNKKKHAWFTIDSSSYGSSTGEFGKAIKSELDIIWKSSENKKE